MVERLTEVGIALQSFGGQEVVLDLKSVEAYLDIEDKMFDRIFGLSDDLEGVLLVAKAEVVAGWPEDLKAKLIVKLPGGSGDVRGLLVSSGVKVSGKVATVADLLDAGGPVEVDDCVVQKVFGSKQAFDTLKSLIEEKFGKKLSGSVATPMYWYEFLGGVK